METGRFFFIPLLLFTYFWLREVWMCAKIGEVLKEGTFLKEYKNRAKSGERAVQLYEKDKMNVIPLNRVYHPIYPIAPNHKLSACVIPKNMSTLLTAILCYLFAPSKWSGSSLNDLTLDSGRSCRDMNELHRMGQLKKAGAMKDNWTNLMLVREPAERFLSGYLYMCTTGSAFAGNCYGCGDDVICVLRRLQNASYAFSKGDHLAESNELWHLGPQNWHCEYYQSPSFFRLIRYSPARKEELVKELSSVLSASNVPPQTVQKIIRQLLTETTPHTTHNRGNGTAKSEIVAKLNSEEGKQLLKNIFYWDYVLFGFEIPY